MVANSRQQSQGLGIWVVRAAILPWLGVLGTAQISSLNVASCCADLTGRVREEEKWLSAVPQA